MATRRAPEKQQHQIRPDHYDKHPSGIECIEVVQWFTFNVGNVIKYLWRCGLKDGQPSIKELKKARTYLDFEIAKLEREEVEQEQRNQRRAEEEKIK